MDLISLFIKFQITQRGGRVLATIDKLSVLDTYACIQKTYLSELYC